MKGDDIELFLVKLYIGLGNTLTLIKKHTLAVLVIPRGSSETTGVVVKFSSE